MAFCSAVCSHPDVIRSFLAPDEPGRTAARKATERKLRVHDLQEEPIVAFAALRAAETTGRPLGTAQFVEDLERRLCRPIARRAPGRKLAARLTAEPLYCEEEVNIAPVIEFQVAPVT